MDDQSKELKELVTKRVSRRTFLMGVAGAASISILGGSLAGCAGGTTGGSPTSTPGGKAPIGTAPAATPAVSSAAQSTKTQGRTLRMMLNGGKYEEVTRAAVVEPFEKKYGVKVEITPADSGQMLTRVRAEKNNPTVDLAVIDDMVAIQGIHEGLFEKVDPKNVPSMKDIDERAIDKNGYGPVVDGVPITFAYNPEKVKIKPPESWADLWKPEYKDMLAMCSINLTPGILFLVQAAQLNGGSYDKMDPGFEAVKRILPNVRKWFHAVSDVRPAVNDDGLIGIMGNSIWQDEIEKGKPLTTIVPKEGSHFLGHTMQIIKGTKNQDLAEMFIDAYLSEAGQTGILKGYYFTMVNKNVKVPENLKKRTTQNVIYFDVEKIAANRDAWNDRWMKEIKA